MTRATKTLEKKSRAKRGEVALKFANAARSIQPYFTSTQLAQAAHMTSDHASKTLNYWAKAGVVEIIGRVQTKMSIAALHLYRTTESFDKMYPKQGTLLPEAVESVEIVKPPRLAIQPDKAIPAAESKGKSKVIPLDAAKKKTREESIADSMEAFVVLMKELVDSLKKAMKEDA